MDVLPKQIRPYQGQRAGIASRAVAAVVDVFVVVLLMIGGYVGWFLISLLLHTGNASLPKVGFGVALLIGLWLAGVYLFVCWIGTGRSIGDKIMGLRVVNFRGELMAIPGAALRAAFCVVFPLGLAWVIPSPSNRSIQDTVLRTSVIYDWRATTPKREGFWRRRRRRSAADAGEHPAPGGSLSH